MNDFKGTKLESKDIAGYLPYRLKAVRKKTDFMDELIIDIIGVSDIDGRYPPEIYNNKEIDGFSIFYRQGEYISGNNLAKYFIPILRPMSDLYKPCLGNGKIPIVELAKIAVLNQNNCDDLCWEIDRSYEYVTAIKREYRYCFGYDNIGTFWINKEDIYDKYYTDIDINSQLELFQKLYEWHFDIHGLIEQGLAIDINTVKG